MSQKDILVNAKKVKNEFSQRSYYFLILKITQGYEGDGTKCCVHSYYAAQIRLLLLELMPPLLKTLDDLQE